jgi:uncharacterized protein YjiS (DUF1127 family)
MCEKDITFASTAAEEESNDTTPQTSIRDEKIMSTTVTTYSGETLRESDKPQSRFARGLQKFIASREAQGRRRVLAYLSSLSDERLADFGYTEAEIREIRAQRLPERSAC